HVRHLLAEARALPQVESAAAVLIPPYEVGGSFGMLSYKDRSTRMSVIETTDDLPAVARLHLAAGRFFGRADDGSNVPPVVINRRLSQRRVDDDDPLGKVIDRGRRSVRVVGVVDEFRQYGELLAGGNVLFE